MSFDNLITVFYSVLIIFSLNTQTVSVIQGPEYKQPSQCDLKLDSFIETEKKRFKKEHPQVKFIMIAKCVGGRERFGI